MSDLARIFDGYILNLRARKHSQNLLFDGLRLLPCLASAPGHPPCGHVVRGTFRGGVAGDDLRSRTGKSSPLPRPPAPRRPRCTRVPRGYDPLLRWLCFCRGAATWRCSSRPKGRPNSHRLADAPSRPALRSGLQGGGQARAAMSDKGDTVIGDRGEQLPVQPDPQDRDDATWMRALVGMLV